VRIYRLCGGKAQIHPNPVYCTGHSCHKHEHTVLQQQAQPKSRGIAQQRSTVSKLQSLHTFAGLLLVREQGDKLQERVAK